jgi:hypothetical protein
MLRQCVSHRINGGINVDLRAGDFGRWTKQILEDEFGAKLNVAGVVALRRN